MSSRLPHIQNWPELAKEANWSASALARNCQVSRRTLERYFIAELGKNPKAWLLGLRQQIAIQLLRDGRSVKETADHLGGYKDASSFSREFNKHWNFPPGVVGRGLDWPREKMSPLAKTLIF